MSGNRGKGRPKGSQNKTTASAKEAIELAFEGMGGAKRLQRWAEENEGDFFKLIFPRLLPVQLNHADNEGGRLVCGWLPSDE